MELTDGQIKNLTLTLIEKHMEKNRRSLKEFKGFPYPTDYVMEELGNRLIYDELNYDEDALKLEFKRLFSTVTGKVQIHWCYFDISNYQFIDLIYILYKFR